MSFAARFERSDFVILRVAFDTVKLRLDIDSKFHFQDSIKGDLDKYFSNMLSAHDLLRRPCSQAASRGVACMVSGHDGINKGL